MNKSWQGLDPPSLMQHVADRLADGTPWRRYRCRLLTPLYGGGVTAGEIDRQMPVRATAIRGQLRFWWRLLNRRRPAFCSGGQPDSGKLFAGERALWGGLGDRDATASQVLLRCEIDSVPEPVAVRVFRPDPKNPGKSIIQWQEWASPYALFPGQGKAGQSAGGTPAAKVIWDKDRDKDRDKDNLRWSVLWTVRAAPDDGGHAETVRQVEEAFRWWATFGGLGARTRRGLGAFAVTEAAGTQFSYVSADEVARAGLQLVLGKAQPDANTAWQEAIEALRAYRQGVGVGRHPPSRGHCSPAGRSCWPEADALRRLVGQHADDHPPRHRAGNVFPRAAFGLPIIFHFKDAGEPADSVCLPLSGGSTRTRLASPLILRPYPAASGRWQPAVLKLPDEHVWAMGVSIEKSKGARSARVLKGFSAGTWWPAPHSPALAGALASTPLAGVANDVLDGFLVFFARRLGVSDATQLDPVEERWEKAQIKFDARNGTVEARGPDNRSAYALQEAGKRIWATLSPEAQQKIGGGFFRADARVKGKELLAVEERR